MCIATIPSGSAAGEEVAVPLAPSPSATVEERLASYERRLEEQEKQLADQAAEVAALRREREAQRREDGETRAARPFLLRRGGWIVALSGFLQADGVLYNQASQDELDPATRRPLNETRFLIPRARLRADAE